MISSVDFHFMVVAVLAGGSCLALAFAAGSLTASVAEFRATSVEEPTRD
jgi:hypothetical protein